MVRRGLMVVVLGVLAPALASAQVSSNAFTGFATLSLGAAHGGDVIDHGWTPGVSMAVIEPGGLGAEVDLSHVREFDETRFLESGITTLTINAIGLWSEPDAIVRPYLLGGLGLLRVRACVIDCRLSANRTDLGMDVGGGAFIVFNEFVGVRADVRYFRFLQRHADLPLTDNGFFDFWRTSLGVTLSWPLR